MPQVFQCARCKRVFKEVEGDDVEASVQASNDFPQDFLSLQNQGGLHKVCISCYNKVMSSGTNTPKIPTVGKFLKNLKINMLKHFKK